MIISKKALIVTSALALLVFRAEHSRACTSIMVGKSASADGSVMTSHTCDSRIDRTWFDIIPEEAYGKDAQCLVYSGRRFIRFPGDTTGLEIVGRIPQAERTNGFIDTAYPCMNDRQVAIGESTFGGRKELRNKNSMFSCEELCRIALERASSARGAIKIIDDLTKKYGYNDGGECLTISDKDEVWHFEIIGSGGDRTGAIWAARRVPDGHVGVTANASRLMEIDTKSDMFMFSDNIFEVAEENGWWDRGSGEPFRFCYAYDPKGRESMAARRREWRVFDILAPSLRLDPNSENYPFSVKPDTLVTLPQVMAIFRDTYEGTEFDMTKFMMVEDPENEGEFIKSPYANPFMDYDMMPLFKINGGWGRLGERCIARYYCTYITITQSRRWMPDPVGGLVWFGWDNPAMTTFVPVYCGIKDVPDSWKVCGRKSFDRDCAWWAFNRVADLSAQKWGHMRVEVDSVRAGFERRVFAERESIEKTAIELYGSSENEAREFLTRYTFDFCSEATESYWRLGDLLWSKYTGKF